MSTEIPVIQTDSWHEAIAQVDKLADRAVELAQALIAAQAQPGLVRELGLVSHMLRMIRFSWDLTETSPGDVAGIVMEIANDEDRTEIRAKIREAIALSEAPIREAEAIIAKLPR